MMSAQPSLPQAMIFDLDGTLFKTETSVIPAYHAVMDQLRQEGLYHGATPPDERMLGSLGMLLDDIWKNILTDSSEAVRQRANELLLQYQLVGLREGQGELYPEVKSTLTKLHELGFKLYIASNGLEDYVNNVIKCQGLQHLFSGLYSAGGYQTKSKVDLVRILLTEHEIHSAWMVGDRSSDVEAGRENGLVVIGCDYAGFGDKRELDGADVIIQDITELLTLVTTNSKP